MKKIVLIAAIEDDSSKKKALKVVAGVQGVDSVAVDMKERKITVIGNVDPIYLTSKLRRFGFTELVSVGPAKEEKKEETKPQSDAKKENKPEIKEIVYFPSSYDYHHYRPYEYIVDNNENPNACTIC